MVFDISTLNSQLSKAKLNELRTQLQQQTLPSEEKEELAIVLGQKFSDKAVKLNRLIALTLADIANPIAVPYLLEQLESEDEMLRFNSAYALSKTRSDEVIPFLRKAIESDDIKLWKSAAVIMKGQKYQNIQELLYESLAEKNEPMLGMAAQYFFNHNIDPKWFKSNAAPETIQEIVQSYKPHTPKIRTSIDSVLQNKFIGSLLGLAIGDAFAAPVEFMSVKNMQKTYGTIDDFVTNPHRPVTAGEYTDDTEMALMIARTLIERGNMDPIHLGNIFGDHLKLVLDGKAPNNGFSHTTLTSMQNLYAGMGWRHSGKESYGAGPAMRVAPVGLFYHDQPKLLQEAARQQAYLTQTSEEAIAGSVTVAYAAAKALHLPPEFDKYAFIDELVTLTSEISDSFSSELARVKNLLDLEASEALPQIPTEGEVGYKAKGVVPSALFCFLKSPEDYRNTILLATYTDGDSDTIAAIAGAISGAYNGTKAIPQKWVDGLKQREKVVKMATDLYLTTPR